MRAILRLFILASLVFSMPAYYVYAEEPAKPAEGEKDVGEGSKDAEVKKKEHPEHPDKAKHEKDKDKSSAKPKGKGKKKKAPSTTWNRNAVQEDLITFINSEKSQSAGMFKVKDEIAKMDRSLTLEKIHTDKIVQIDDGTSFVCADFADASGDKIDVDFFMTASDDGHVANVKKVQVHKVNGNPRYTYVERNGEWIQEASQEPTKTN